MLSWLKRGNRVMWVEDGFKIQGLVVGLTDLLGKRGYEKGVLWVNVEIVCGERGAWWVNYEKGFVRLVELRKGKFWVLVGGKMRKVG